MRGPLYGDKVAPSHLYDTVERRRELAEPWAPWAIDFSMGGADARGLRFLRNPASPVQISWSGDASSLLLSNMSTVQAMARALVGLRSWCYTIDETTRLEAVEAHTSLNAMMLGLTGVPSMSPDLVDPIHPDWIRVSFLIALHPPVQLPEFILGEAARWLNDRGALHRPLERLLFCGPTPSSPVTSELSTQRNKVSDGKSKDIDRS